MEQTPEKEKLVLLPVATADAVLSYLGSRPYVEVALLVQRIQACQIEERGDES